MRKTKGSFAPFWFGLFMVAVVYSCGSFYVMGVLRDENTVLKHEIDEWQIAARPAIDARGWDLRYFESSGLKPENLRNALDPCLNIGGRHLETDECDEIVAYWKNGQRFPAEIPIKIVIAR